MTPAINATPVTDSFFACRRDHIAGLLLDAEQDGSGFEARCPECGHPGFRVDRPTRSTRYRHIWTCACGRCKCKAGTLRAALLRLGISRDCLGAYDGPVQHDIQPETARRMDMAIRDILAVPGLKPADIRIMLAEAQGAKVPDDYTGFVKFARQAGIGHQQAYEAARRWVGRPSDCPPSNRGEVVDTSRTTEPTGDVKPLRSQLRGPTETVEPPYGNRRNPEVDGLRKP